MKNDPASIQDAGNQGFIQDASFATTDDGGTGGASYTNTGHAKLVGVLNGFFYTHLGSGWAKIRYPGPLIKGCRFKSTSCTR